MAGCIKHVHLGEDDSSGDDSDYVDTDDVETTGENDRTKGH